jgi:uncharacterized membrane protein YoaT (DUF817 family)
MRDILLGLAIFGASIAAVCMLWPRPWILFLICCAIVAIMFARWHGRADVAAFLVAALLGTLADLLAISRGAWMYGGAGTSIPCWLPLTWGIAGLLISRVSRGLIRVRSTDGQRAWEGGADGGDAAPPP